MMIFKVNGDHLVLDELKYSKEEKINEKNGRNMDCKNQLNVQKVGVRESSIQQLLSPRELQVLLGVYEGLSNKEIADKLYLSLGTVKGYTHQIYTKMGVKNRVQAALIARNLFCKP